MSTTEQPSPAQKRAVDITVAITNLIKLGGLVLGVHTGFSAHPYPGSLALAGLMMAGAQFSERTLIAFLNRFFGRVEEIPPRVESK